MNNHQFDDISLYPLRKDLKGYSLETFYQDAAAGLSVALLTVPQAMAYAMLAGLPISCGFFAAIYSTIIAAAFGSSRQMVVGPGNALAILVQTGVGEILFTYYRDVTGIERDIVAVQVLTQLTLLIGIMQMIVSWCKLGRLTQFVSHSVIVGYIAGTAFAMIINQLFIFLGMPRMEGVHSFYEKGAYILTHLPALHVPTALIGAGSLVLLLIIKKIDKRIPAAVITFAVAGAIAYYFDLSSYAFEPGLHDPYSDEEVRQVLLVGDTEEVFDVFPRLGWPFFDTGIMNNLLPVAFAIGLLSILETASVAKTIAASSGQRLAINQEIFGLGCGNLLSSLIGAMPVSGSPSRSTVNYDNGAQTRFASILNAFFALLILVLLGFIITRIPLSSLSALLLVSAASVINTKQLALCLKATSSDAFVLWITFFSCMFFSLDVAFYIGVALSIILYLKKAAIPQLVEYEISEEGELKNLDFAKQHEHRTIRIIKVEGELFFGAADLFQTTLKAIAEDDTSTKVIVLQLKNARDIDATGCLALEQLHDYLKGSGRHLIACGITAQIWEVMSDSGIVERLGKENLFIFDEKHPHHFMHKAFQRAKHLSELSLVEEQVPEISAEPVMVQDPTS